jgi:predicted dehydrogenase
MTRLRLIQVGVAGWGWSWADITKRSEDWNVVAYVDIDKRNLTEASAYYGLPDSKCFTDVEEAIREVDADGILVCTPPGSHAAVTTKAFESGLHVLVEKPVANDIQAAKEMIAAADKHKLKLMVSEQYRYRRGPRTAKKLMAEKVVGDPVYVLVNFHQPAPTPREVPSFFTPGKKEHRLEMPDILLLDTAIHHFDLIRSVLGVEPLSVSTESWNVPWSPFKGDCVTLVSWKMERGIRVVYFGSWVSQHWQTTWDGDWRINCTKGEIHWYENKVEVSAPLFDQVWTKNMLTRSQGILEAQLVDMKLEDREYSLHEFAEAILQDREPETSGRENLKTFAATLAAIDSAHEKREVMVKDYLG